MNERKLSRRCSLKNPTVLLSFKELFVCVVASFEKSDVTFVPGRSQQQDCDECCYCVYINSYIARLFHLRKDWYLGRFPFPSHYMTFYMIITVTDIRQWEPRYAMTCWQHVVVIVMSGSRWSCDLWLLYLKSISSLSVCLTLYLGGFLFLFCWSLSSTLTDLKETPAPFLALPLFVGFDEDQAISSLPAYMLGSKYKP
jgi:hypothetical protein